MCFFSTRFPGTQLIQLIQLNSLIATENSRLREGEQKWKIAAAR